MARSRSRIGVIGTGWWATYAHLPSLTSYDRALGAITAEDDHRAADVQTVRGSVLPRGRALRQGELRAVFGACLDDPTPLAIRDGAILAVL